MTPQNPKPAAPAPRHDELVGLAAHFSPLDLDCLVRTAADAVHGDPDDLSQHQRDLAGRVRALMDQEMHGQLPAGTAPHGAYAQMVAARGQMARDAEQTAAEFADLLRTLYPGAAHIVLRITDDDTVALRRAVAADGSTLHTFDDLTRSLPPLPEALAHQWWPHDLTRETTLDHIADELREAGVVYPSLPEQARDLDDDPYQYIPSIDLGAAA
jgi:hypothetical protein